MFHIISAGAALVHSLIRWTLADNSGAIGDDQHKTYIVEQTSAIGHLGENRVNDWKKGNCQSSPTENHRNATVLETEFLLHYECGQQPGHSEDPGHSTDKFAEDDTSVSEQKLDECSEMQNSLQRDERTNCGRTLRNNKSNYVPDMTQKDQLTNTLEPHPSQNDCNGDTLKSPVTENVFLERRDIADADNRPARKSTEVICLLSTELSHIIPADRAVRGLTVVGNLLYIIRGPSKGQLEIYNAATLAYIGSLVIPGLSDSSHGMASHPGDHFIYIGDFIKDTAHRVNVDSARCSSGELNVDQIDQICWRTDSGLTGLSVNANKNVLASCWGAGKIQEYAFKSESGAVPTLVREIRLPSNDITCPLHAVELSNNRFAVSHTGRNGQPDRVCIIDGKGHVLRRADCSTSSEPGQAQCRLERPTHIAVCNGFLIVADSGGNRIIILSQLLDSSSEVPVPESVGDLRQPRVVHFEESVNRLFIGEDLGGRVIAYDINFLSFC